MMDLIIDSDGTIRCLYGEAIDLRLLGKAVVRRASHVEPDEQGRWWGDMSPVGGPRLGPFTRRSEAIEQERLWLDDWLARAPRT